MVFIKKYLEILQDRDQHTVHLRTVLQTLREHQLHSKHKKYEYWFEVMVFLEHMVLKEETKADL